MILLVARVIVGCVFAVAGVAKLADLGGARASLTEFGVPRRLVGPASVALPIAELAVAGLLIATSTARVAAAAATVLLLVFAAAIGAQLARGRRPDCNCFGRVGSTRAGWPALCRNLGLGAVAATVAIAGPGQSIGRALGSVAPAVIVVVVALVVVIVALGWFNFQLFAQNARLLERVTRLEQGQPAGTRSGTAATAPPSIPAGSPAPDFVLPDLVGRRWSLADLLTPGRALVLVFLDPSCPVCWQIVPGLERIAAGRAGELELAIVTRGAAVDVSARLDPAFSGPVLLQQSREVAERFGIVGVPSAVMVDHRSRISGPAVFGAAEIERLLAGPAVDGPVSLAVTR